MVTKVSSKQYKAYIDQLFAEPVKTKGSTFVTQAKKSVSQILAGPDFASPGGTVALMMMFQPDFDAQMLHTRDPRHPLLADMAYTRSPLDALEGEPDLEKAVKNMQTILTHLAKVQKQQPHNKLGLTKTWVKQTQQHLRSRTLNQCIKYNRYHQQIEHDAGELIPTCWGGVVAPKVKIAKELHQILKIFEQDHDPDVLREQGVNPKILDVLKDPPTGVKQRFTHQQFAKKFDLAIKKEANSPSQWKNEARVIVLRKILRIARNETRRALEDPATLKSARKAFEKVEQQLDKLWDKENDLPDFKQVAIKAREISNRHDTAVKSMQKSASAPSLQKGLAEMMGGGLGMFKRSGSADSYFKPDKSQSSKETKTTEPNAEPTFKK